MLIWTLFKLLSAESASSREEFSSSTCGNIIQVQKVNRQFNGFYTKSEQKNNSTPVYTRLGSDTVLQYADNRWKFEDHKNITFLHSFITEERCPTAVRNWLYRTKVHRDIIDEYRGIRSYFDQCYAQVVQASRSSRSVQVELNRVKRLFRDISLEADTKPMLEQIKLLMALKSTKEASFFKSCISYPIQFIYQDEMKKLRLTKKAGKSRKFACSLSRALC